MKINKVLLSAVAALLFASAVHANQTISVPMTYIADSYVAFTGTCVSVEPMMYTSAKATKAIPATRYTFLVSEVLKGDIKPSEKLSYVQFGLSRADAVRLKAPYIPGTPLIEKGTEYTIFLDTPTVLPSSPNEIGLTAPIGLGQGKFHVITAADGTRQVVNETNNENLFDTPAARPQVMKAFKSAGVAEPARSGPIDYNSFINVVRELQKKE